MLGELSKPLEFEGFRNGLVKIITVAFFSVFLFGCTTTGSSIVTGNTRPAVRPADVKIYIDPPSQYETVGLIEASSSVEFSRQAAQDRVINKLKLQAAKMGANGVFLCDIKSQSDGMIGFYSGNMFYAGTIDKITSQGRAIYVILE